MKNIADEFTFSRLAKIKKPFSIDYVIPEIIKYGGTIKIDEQNLIDRLQSFINHPNADQEAVDTIWIYNFQNKPA